MNVDFGLYDVRHLSKGETMEIQTPLELVAPVGRQVTIPEAIAGQLIRLIMNGNYPPGSRLSTEQQLAEQFRTGRGAVREALKALTIVGLLRVERGKGTFVEDRSSFLVRPILLGLKADTEIQSLIEARELIEVELVGLAAERREVRELQSIKACLDRMVNHTSVEERNQFLEADVGFHFAIAQAAHNPILCQSLTLIRNLTQEWLSFTLLEPGVAAEALTEHQQIFDAIRTRKSAAARKIMLRHLAISAKRLLAAKEAQQKASTPPIAVA
jgi:GntR family transcriptional repressor for pyruvate dehydrogenase complex